MSAILLFLANLRLIEALDADESMKHIFLPMLAKDAINKKYFGKAKVVISIQKARFKTATDISLHFLMSASKFLPNFPAKMIAPSCPKPSLSTHVYAAAATFAYAIVLPRATKRHYVVKKPIVINVIDPMHEIHVNFK